MNKQLYSFFRKAVLTDSKMEYIRKIMEQTELSYRTVRALTQIINNEPDMTDNVLNKLTDVSFYTLENMVKVAKEGLLDIVPAEFFCNDEFLAKTGINKLPDRFCANDDELEGFVVNPRILYIGNEAFAGCTNLKTITLPEGLLEIYDGAFKNCRSLVIEEFPDNIYYIGNEAFSGCLSLLRIKFPPKTNKVQTKTFYNCENLVEFSTKTPIRVGHKSFAGCLQLFEVNAILMNTETESFANCRQLDDLTFQNGIIGKRAFMGCDNLSSLKFICGSVLEIQEDAFIGCSNLSCVNIDGYTYQMNETKGYREITRNLRKIMSENGKMVTYYDFNRKATVKEIIEKIS